MIPKTMKIIPDAIFRIFSGIRLVTQDPVAIAMPSTRKNAQTTPINKGIYFFVFEENRIMASCVLSPSSATNIAIRGTTRSSMIGFFLLVFS
jgi:hypothetical protein